MTLEINKFVETPHQLRKEWKAHCQQAMNDDVVEH